MVVNRLIAQFINSVMQHCVVNKGNYPGNLIAILAFPIVKNIIAVNQHKK